MTTTRPQTTDSTPSVNELAGKYMTFKLASEEYGVQILKVRELIGLMDITAIPRAPEFVRGIINLRGKIIPVLDLRLRFGLPVSADSSQAVIIVTQLATPLGPLTMGVLVDQVLEVRTIEAAHIEPSPRFPGSASTEFVLGVGKAEARVILLLDIECVLAPARDPLLAEVLENHALNV